MRARSLIFALVLVVGVLAVPLAATASDTIDNAAVGQRATTVNALQLLRRLTTRAERNGNYDRSKFADWYDADGDGCDTREEVLIAESLRRVRKGPGCDIRRGRWFSKYDGQVFTRPGNLDIDHMVPLAEAWGSGAKAWNARTRDRYANDLGYAFSLIAVSASSNRSKSDRDPSEWLPPRERFRCEYVKQYTAVKFRWHLKVNKAEKLSLRREIRQCGDRRILKPHRVDIDRRGSGGGGGGGGGRCSPHYSGACIPIRTDVDCGEITARNFHVVDVDVYDLDADGDGIACET